MSNTLTPGRRGWIDHRHALVSNGWSNVNGCWEYNGSRTVQGYGRISVKGVTKKAHRVAYESVHGPIPEGMVIRHTCDNPPCVNPDHLIIGTHQDNADDMVSRGRSFRGTGEAHSQARLTADQVDEIRNKYVPHKYTLSMLAEEYGISFQHVSDIIHRKKWR